LFKNNCTSAKVIILNAFQVGLVLIRQRKMLIQK
jgi:hypothetical protein